MRSECKPKEFSKSVPSWYQSYSRVNFVCSSYLSSSCWVSHDSRFSLFPVCIDNCSCLRAWDIRLGSIGTCTISLSRLGSKGDRSRARANGINQISFFVCSYRISTCVRCASKISGYASLTNCIRSTSSRIKTSLKLSREVTRGHCIRECWSGLVCDRH